LITALCVCTVSISTFNCSGYREIGDRFPPRYARGRDDES